MSRLIQQVAVMKRPSLWNEKLLRLLNLSDDKLQTRESVSPQENFGNLILLNHFQRPRIQIPTQNKLVST
jgi:hypothetical protein